MILSQVKVGEYNCVTDVSLQDRHAWYTSKTDDATLKSSAGSVFRQSRPCIVIAAANKTLLHSNNRAGLRSPAVERVEKRDQS